MTVHQRRAYRMAGAVLGVIALASMTACGGSTSAANTAPPPTGAASAAGSNTVTVDGLDYSYKISGSPHAGLVSMTFANKGQYAHEMGLARMKDGVTLEALKGALAKSEDAAKAMLIDPDSETTGPATVGPQRTETVTAPLDAGHYVVTCFLPGPDGMPHVMMGMIGEFTVTGGGAGVAPPKDDGIVALTDTGITLPTNFATGGTFEVRNTGTKPHDFSVTTLTGQPLMAFFQCVGQSMEKSTPIDTCPGSLVAGVTGVPPGKSAYLSVTLPKGDYGYVSTQGEGADFQAGLHGTVTVS